MNQEIELKLKAILKIVVEVYGTLEQALDGSLLNPHMDANSYIRRYNACLQKVTSQLADDDVFGIFEEMQLYEFTGDDVTDVAKVKEKLVEVYLRTAQLMGYLENKLEFG